MKATHIAFFLAAAFTGIACPAYASSLVFEGQNPAVFSGANPGNSAALMASVNRPKDPSQASALGALTPTSILEQSILGQISAKINDKIFNSNPGDSGSFSLGGGNFGSYTNVGGVITVTLTDSHGVTTITY